MDFDELSYQILLCANRGHPNIDFLVSVSKLLLSFLNCDALEIWLNEGNKCSRWCGTQNPMRFVRLDDVPVETLLTVLKNGATWTNNPTEAKGSSSKQHQQAMIQGITISKEYLSIGVFPSTIDEDDTSLLIIKRRNPGYFSSKSVALCNNLSRLLAMAATFQRVRLAQKERVKELTCLYEIEKSSSQLEMNLDMIIERIAACLPPAWQYPEITWAKIVLDGKEYATKKVGRERHAMSADIIVEGQTRGYVEVIYGEGKPDIDEGPFLKEERSLIDVVAREVAHVIEQKKTEADRKILLEQLRHADRLATIGQLAAGVAHELNEPLGGILGFAQLAKKHDALPPAVERDLEKIENATLHAREVIRKLMLFARQAPPRKTRVDLNKVVEDGIYFFEARCAKTGIRLKRSFEDKLIDIVADAAQLNQVLINLVVNAIQAMPDGGTLTISTSERNNWATLQIADTGIGMSEDVLNRIFDPFFTTKDVGEGTGLGLPVVHGIVTAHGGKLEYKSKPGHGTQCEVRFPAAGVLEHEQKKKRK